MGDIEVLNPLQTLVPACGQVQIGSEGDARGARCSKLAFRRHSVGSVLLDVRFGKLGTPALPNSSYRCVASSAPPLWFLYSDRSAWSRPRAGTGGALLSLQGADRRRASSWGRWINTEVGLT